MQLWIYLKTNDSPGIINKTEMLRWFVYNRFIKKVHLMTNIYKKVWKTITFNVIMSWNDSDVSKLFAAVFGEKLSCGSIFSLIPSALINALLSNVGPSIVNYLKRQRFFWRENRFWNAMRYIFSISHLYVTLQLLPAAANGIK